VLNFGCVCLLGNELLFRLDGGDTVSAAGVAMALRALETWLCGDFLAACVPGTILLNDDFAD